MKTLKSIKEWIDNKIEDFHIWILDAFPLHLCEFLLICYGFIFIGLTIIFLVE